VGGAVAGMMPGHHHGQQGTEQGYGAARVGGGQQSYENQVPRCPTCSCLCGCMDLMMPLLDQHSA
jgi:hypothetical protein